VLVSGVQRRGLAPLEMVRDSGIPIISCWSVVSSRCLVWLLILMLVRCFVPLFSLVAYFDVGLLFRPVV
jgi:hypothetical protein